MPNTFKVTLWVLMTLLCILAKAQPFNTFSNNNTNVPVVLEPLREADIAFQWTLERIIDTREKQNLALNWPQNSLRNIVYKAVLTGTVPAYTNSNFTEKIADTAIGSIGWGCITVSITNGDDVYDVIDTMICEPPDIEKLVKWKVIEQWYFDREQSRMIPRIIGLALMYRPIVAGLELPETPLFWVKYDEIRPQLAQSQMLNPHNQSASMSFDYFFTGRHFSSYITKYPNVYDLPINAMEEYADNSLGAQYQSVVIKNKLFEVEHDLWEF